MLSVTREPAARTSPNSAPQKLEEKLQAQADYEEIKTELRYGSTGVRACCLPIPWPAGCHWHPGHPRWRRQAASTKSHPLASLAAS